MINNISELIENLPVDAHKYVFSQPSSNAVPYKKVTVTLTENLFRVEALTGKQAFHSVVTDINSYILSLLGTQFRQMNAWDAEYEYSFRISKKGTVLHNRSKPGGTIPKIQDAHNRKKNYILPEGTVVPPLVDMGIMTPEGYIVKAMYDKYRQINRFVEIIGDETAMLRTLDEVNIIDFGCGKSYLTFVVYYYMTQILGLNTRITGLDIKEDVIAKCNKTAEKYGYVNLRFVAGDINTFSNSSQTDMVLCLHACDTATDYALYNAVKLNAKLIFAVPCCQHELNQQMSAGELSLLTRYGIIQERFSALITDALRANLLTACGYKTQILEFIDLSHTPKNLLIRAVKTPLPALSRSNTLSEVSQVMKQFSLNPALYNLLRNDGII